jgi:hypothetical protein
VQFLVVTHWRISWIANFHFGCFVLQHGQIGESCQFIIERAQLRLQLSPPLNFASAVCRDAHKGEIQAGIEEKDPLGKESCKRAH